MVHSSTQVLSYQQPLDLLRKIDNSPLEGSPHATGAQALDSSSDMASHVWEASTSELCPKS